MYNRYIPEDTVYTPIPEEVPLQREKPSPPKTDQRPSQATRPLPFALPKGLEGLTALLRNPVGKIRGLRLSDIDSGDILLLLILLLLLKEGDDIDLVIALGLVLLMGLGDSEKE